MLAGILKSRTATSDSDLVSAFVQPIQIISHQRGVQQSGLNLSRSLGSVRAQRWEIEAAIMPVNTGDALVAHTLRFSRGDRPIVRVPQPPNCWKLPNLACYIDSTRSVAAGQHLAGSSWIYYDYVTSGSFGPMQVGRMFSFNGLPSGLVKKLRVVTAIEGDRLHFWPPLTKDNQGRDSWGSYLLSSPWFTIMVARPLLDYAVEYDLGILGRPPTINLVEAPEE